jgi:hypothetical protein
MTYAAAPMRARGCGSALNFYRQIAERVERKPASLGILTLIEFARGP